MVLSQTAAADLIFKSNNRRQATQQPRDSKECFLSRSQPTTGQVGPVSVSMWLQSDCHSFASASTQTPLDAKKQAPRAPDLAAIHMARYRLPDPLLDLRRAHILV